MKHNSLCAYAVHHTIAHHPGRGKDLAQLEKVRPIFAVAQTPNTLQHISQVKEEEEEDFVNWTVKHGRIHAVPNTSHARLQIILFASCDDRFLNDIHIGLAQCVHLIDCRLLRAGCSLHNLLACTLCRRSSSQDQIACEPKMWLACCSFMTDA